MRKLYHVQIAPGISFEAAGEEAMGRRIGVKALVKCEFYQDLALVKGVSQTPFDTPEEIQRVQERQERGRHVEGHIIPEILRIADEADLRRGIHNEATADGMRRKTIERIRAHGLEMRLIQSHLTWDGRLLLCQFTADGRVDFRQLLQDLSSLFRTRIELRQVGVRDEAAIIGGVGSCGRPFCCATFLHNIASVNVRMAKEQGLSLTPQNISGACGRLKCCLHFEHNNGIHAHDAETAPTGEGAVEEAPRRREHDRERERPPRVKPPFAPRRRDNAQHRPPEPAKPPKPAHPDGMGITIPLKTAGLVPLKKSPKQT